MSFSYTLIRNIQKRLDFNIYDSKYTLLSRLLELKMVGISW